jgi:hypothetical protein
MGHDVANEIPIWVGASTPHIAPMTHVTVRLYAELNECLRPAYRSRPFLFEFEPPCDVKGILDSLQVPRDQVDLVLVNGESVDFVHAVNEGDRISVYPVFETFDIRSVVKIRAHPLRETRFVLDTHLGKLAYHLRMLGFDTLYRNDYNDDQLIAVSNDERRILLTRDRRLLASDRISRGCHVRETDPRRQLIEILRRFHLNASVKPFQRCLRCNSLLHKVDKSQIVDRLPQKAKEAYEEFEICETCQRVYWKGSHYQRMQEFIRSVLDAGQMEDRRNVQTPPLPSS